MIKTLLSVLSSLLLALPAGAQVLPAVREQIKDVREAAGGQIRETREATKTAIKETAENVREAKKEAAEAIKQKRAEAQEAIQKKREEFKKEVEEKRAEAKEQIKTKQAELKERLAKIKDERKKNIVEKIDKEINALNERRVKHFTEVLEKIEKVLERIGTRTDKAEAKGLDVAAVRQAITEANNAIAASRAAVQSQSAKVYTIGVTTEETLKLEVGKTRQALRDDLAKVQETVKAAHEAVKKAAVTLAQIPKVDEEESTSSESNTQ